MADESEYSGIICIDFVDVDGIHVKLHNVDSIVKFSKYSLL